MKYLFLAVFSVMFLACSGEGGGVSFNEVSSSSTIGSIESSSSSSAITGQGQDFTRAHYVNKLLGRGMNFGNAFDAQCRRNIDFCTDYPLENAMVEPTQGWDGCWSNSIKKEWFGIIKAAGFKSVRLPVRWAEKASDVEPFEIPAEFTAAVKKVVDWSIEEGLPIIINIHHYNELYDDNRCRTDLETQQKKFLGLWEQIADTFKDYHNDSLIFEVLNEPRARIDNVVLNKMLADVWPIMREKNPDRTIMINSSDWGKYSTLPFINIPGNDPNVILSGHYYNPHAFSHQGESGAATGVVWGSSREQAILKGEIEETYQKIKEKWPGIDGGTIPLNIGEFGISNKANLDQRAEWTALLRSEMEKRNMSWHYWSFPGAGAFDSYKSGAWIQEILEALMPEEN